MRSKRIRRGSRSRFARPALIAVALAAAAVGSAWSEYGPSHPGFASTAGMQPAAAAPAQIRAVDESTVSWPPVAGLSNAQSQEIARRIGSMSTEEKVGQLVIAGVEGIKPDKEAETLVRDYRVGGFILFRDNMKTLQGTVDFLNGLKALNKAEGNLPLMLGVDEEGGKVTRMPASVEKIPSNGIIGKSANAEYARDVSQLLARRVKAFGFSVDFAPVLDVNSNPDNPVIGDRSYGSSAQLVTKLGTAAMLGFKKEGILGVLKHFPGHGDTSVDSHKQLPVTGNGLSRLQEVELPPFQAAIDQGADAVMVAHILLPKLDAEYPASMSRPVITGLLRDKMKFNGLVFSDDLTMGAILENYDVGDAAVRTISAGGDIVIVSHGNDNIIHVLQKLRQAAADGSIPATRLNESVYRIMARKLQYQMTDGKVSSISVDQLNKDALKVLDAYRK
ncbi:MULTISPECIES: beta-N-acetylhexosaminidase [Paenibacillus]|uniref:beta-N-acetylhexosaminidase n=1 Tax=Paenibacillus TaxID=44249 RepID=UPI00040BCE81|nr:MULTISPECIES: beta-N-acetylhexosaminidase [Paenibacillus]KKC48538.1 hypothetical protein VE23_17995 [Paenibacillus sp. D9]CDN44809.1 Putative anhydromuramoyl-peptide exo-beta-N-acetylglucosaminidase [Paenibacillus sp. P22]